MKDAVFNTKRRTALTTFRVFLLCLGLLALAITTGCATSASPSRLERAVEEMDRGNYDGARHILDHLLAEEAGEDDSNSNSDGRQAGKDRGS